MVYILYTSHAKMKSNILADVTLTVLLPLKNFSYHIVIPVYDTHIEDI